MVVQQPRFRRRGHTEIVDASPSTEHRWGDTFDNRNLQSGGAAEVGHVTVGFKRSRCWQLEA